MSAFWLLIFWCRYKPVAKYAKTEEVWAARPPTYLVQKATSEPTIVNVRIRALSLLSPLRAAPRFPDIWSYILFYNGCKFLKAFQHVKFFSRQWLCEAPKTVAGSELDRIRSGLNSGYVNMPAGPSVTSRVVNYFTNMKLCIGQITNIFLGVSRQWIKENCFLTELQDLMQNSQAHMVGRA
ncbi:hypothetical protein J6590_055743 [Homalodisca vitripennis]|nr:hypothetical protein J6590_055743 [Homalodisca vitripennis]